MSVGTRIKRIRKIRGMTQKELGIALGYDEKSADVRIAQYESNKRTPKQDTIMKLAEILDVNYRTLRDPSPFNDENATYCAEEIMNILFSLDDQGVIQLFNYTDESDKYDPRKIIGINIQYPLVQNFLKEFKVRQDELKNGEITKEEYDEWKLNWPKTCDDLGKFKPSKIWRKE